MLLASPIDGRPLRPDGPHALTDGIARYPVVDGIPFLRSGREAMRGRALDHLDDGDLDGARIVLLADQDDFAPMEPASEAAISALLDEMRAGQCTLRRAMDLLAFEHVGVYFAHRWSTPTFLSGLGLVDRFWTGPDLFVEIACGIGQMLREVARNGAKAVGVDVVFAKLWLARSFVVPQATLVCADVDTGIPLVATTPATVFCHDAFYFLRRKAEILADMRRVAGPSGTVLVGHAHNLRVDHRIAGTPLDPHGYAMLAPDAALFDDAAFVEEALGGARASVSTAGDLTEVEAISMAIGIAGEARGVVSMPAPGTPLRLNPLLIDGGDGRLAPGWPDPRFAQEYGATDYLRAARPSDDVLRAAAAGAWTAEIAALARRRVLLDLPSSW